ncbi:helicase domain protein (plasmid) [Leptolyngbya boryana NIES-2135]|uniref:Helicase domain protein n=1 Tax=Leptolyngbya boryana NIES-2135 TaxID=1973484 RepID=A0A1Z4JRN4_LEPBY|nr:MULTISPECIES: hypothetical protein [Leptolyngbya]BAY59333.1 helicase domain protein [Leptolyngbya boryana NIES-2135]MBD2372922.1 hypothetical protein [Leptolyngbya sp. FACHB-238]MBD2397325.1 hypothetical protein [Leptolyngbya sp. FACHB-239]MBD2403870.1 hypothetical protein [Leptolyngbya sp. FACHB-402]ULP33167.1 hypothetical protein MCP04_30825 [Leptolyngbya boryana IU 594]
MVALQSQYAPRSRGTGIDTVTPTNMTTALALSLDRVEQVTGLNVDTYVATKLGIDRETLHDRYAAEQIDTLAITYLNLERGKVTLIGNDTGTGKGRIVCGLIQSVIAPIALPDVSQLSESEKEQAIAQIIETAQTASQNQQIAVFLTAKPELYVDMLGRDMVDTGIKDRIRPFFTNAGLDLELKAPDGQTLGFIRTGGSAERSREMRRLINEFHKTGKIGDYNVVFTTYDQLKEKGSIRRQFIEAIAPAATFILDECDLGGGASGPQPELNASQKRQQAAGGDIRSTSGFLTEVVLPNSRNYALLSATAFKDPYVLARLLYPKSEIQQTGLSAEALASTLVRQGTPAQQDFTSKLAMAGELVRLEKSMEGVEFTNTLVTVNLTKFQQSIEVMRLIVEFDRAKRLAIHTLEEAAYVRAERVKAVDASAGEASVTSTLFSSTAYNFAQQLLFALSSESIANKAISEIEAGRKPIVGFYNTMQSALEFYLDAQYDEIFEAIKADYREQHFDLIRVEHPDVAPDIWEEIFQSQYLGAIVAAAKSEYQAWIATNPEIGLNVGDLLLRQLEKCRWVTIGDAYGEKSRYRMTDDELGVGAIEIVNQIQRRVEALDWSGIPISPIDDILHRIAQRGYSIAEMSGRSLGLDYSSGTPRLKTVNASDVQVRTDAKAAFNNGTSDALITNITTGWSAHASRTFQDQRQRVLIVGQAHPDVNKFVQFLGRANRTGQLNPAKHSPDQIESGRPTWGRVTERYDIPGAFGLPRSELIIAEGIPYVQRIVSEINRKMDSLNANTTGNRQSAQSFDGPSFSNSAGDTVAAQLLKDDDELNQALDYPLVNSETNDGAAKKVTGRAIFLPLEEQGRLFATLTERFNAYITQQEALGESPLEQKTLNLEARTQERLELIEAQSTSHLFGGAVTVERMLIKALRKPYSSEQIRDEIRSRLNLDDMPVQPDDFAAGSALREAAGEQVATRLDDADERVTQQLQDYEQKLDQLAQRLLPKAGLLRDRTQLDSDIKALSEQKDEPVDKAVNQEIKQKQAELKKVESKLKKLEKIEQDQATLRSRKQDIETRWKSVRALISDYSPGQSVSIRTSNGAMLGIMLDCQRNEGVKSPVAGSAWKLTIAVVDSSRELTLTIGDVLPPSGRITLQPMDFGLRADPNTGDIELLPVPALFDRAQSETHELREMLTGNLLNAKNGGKYVSFTTAQGVVRQGILLPRESNVEKELASAPIVVANFAQARQLISEGAVLRTPDNLTLQKTSRIMDDNTRRAGVEVAVSASRRGGGHYYTDVELLKCTLNREGKPGFAKHSDKMKAFVPDENLEAFVKLLSQTGTPLQVTQSAFKERAREVTGQELKTFAAISNDDLGMAEFQIPVEQIRAEIEQHRLKNSTLIAESIDEIDDERSDIDVLIDAYQQHFANGSQFQDIRQARQFGIEQLEQLGRSTNFLDRTIEECIESGIVQQAKQLAEAHRANPLAAFDALVELYERQPNLSARTSDSILLQQYSTPVPLGLLVQELAQIQIAQTVWEPTAGNGALLTATTRSTQVLANEIDSSRAERLRSQGYEVTERDATEFRLPTQVDVVVANPPFGKSDDHTGSPKQWEVDLGNNPAPGTRAYPTTQMDHAIAFKSLSAMNDQGRAVLVLGAPMDQKVGRNPSKAYNGSDKRAFFFTLYNNYNVTQHFTVSGDLYGKQGTSFPVDVVVIEGRGKSALPLPAAQNPPVYREWAQLRAVLAKALERNGTIAAPQVTRSSERPQATRSANIESEIAPSDITAPEQESEQLDNLESNPGEENEAATSSPRRSSRSQPNNPTSIDLPVPTVSESTAIEPPESLQIPREQLSLLEKQATRFLYDSGIAEAILEGDQFELGVDHETYQPLAIQCQENRLSFTRCREIDGDFILDSEAVFQIEPTGHLRFVEVASPLPTGQVVRSPDRAFAMSLIRALYDGGFVEATQAAYERSRPEAIALRLANSIRSLLGRDINTVLSRQVEIDGLDYVFESGRMLVPGSRRFYDFISVIDISESLARPVFSVEDMDNQPSATVFDQTHLRRLRAEIESEDFVVFLPGEPNARSMAIEELVDNSAVLGANRLNELSIVSEAVIQSAETASAGEREIAAKAHQQVPVIAFEQTPQQVALDRLYRFLAGDDSNAVLPLTEELTELEQQLAAAWREDCADVVKSVADKDAFLDFNPAALPYSPEVEPILDRIERLIETLDWSPPKPWATAQGIRGSDIARQVARLIYTADRNQVFSQSFDRLREFMLNDPVLGMQSSVLAGAPDLETAQAVFEQRFDQILSDWLRENPDQNQRYHRHLLLPTEQAAVRQQLREAWQNSIGITSSAPLTESANTNDAISERVQPATTLAELQNRYPSYTFDQNRSRLDRYSDITLFVYDPDGALAAHVNVSQFGNVAYANAQQQIERHEILRATEPFPALRAEFPALRFEQRLSTVGIVIDAFSKETRERVTIGRLTDKDNNPTPHQLAEFIEKLRNLGYSTGVKQDATVTDPVAEVTSIVLEDNILEALRKIEILPFPLNHYLEEKIATPDAIVLIQNPALGCYECFGEIATSVARLTGGQIRTMEVEDLEVPFSRFPKSRLDQVVQQLQFQQEVVVAHGKHDRDIFPIVLLAPEEMPLLSVDQPTLRYEGGIVVFNREEIAAIAETFAQQHQYSRAELRDNLSRIVSTALPAQQIEAAVTALLDDDCRGTQFSQSSLNISTPSAEQQEWEAFVQANTKTYGRGEKTALERFTQIQTRIKQTLTLPDTLDRKTVKLSLQALKEAVATNQGQQVLRNLTTDENAHVDGSTLALRLVQEASEIRRSYVEAKINAIEPLLQDLQARYSEYRFHRSNWAKTEGEVYPYINICDTADQRVASIYFVEATPKSIENAEAKLQEHRATVVQSTPQRECDKVPAAAIDQIRHHLNQLAEIVTRIDAAQQNDQQINANGRYEFEAVGGQQREQIDRTIAIATAAFDQFRNLAPTRNIDADRVFAELGGIPTVPALSELSQAWAQQHSHAHEIPLEHQTLTPGYATIETTWGVLTATVTPRNDDFLQVEVIGSTANWHEYPSEVYIGYVSVDEWSEMDKNLSNLSAFAQFVIEDRHTQFLHQLDQERDRIQSNLERWLNGQPEIELESVLASDQAREALIDRFQSIYPERDRVDLTVEFRRLAILSILAPDRLVEFMQSASLSTASDLEPQTTLFTSVENSSEAAQPDEQQLTLLSLDQWAMTDQFTDWDDPATLPTPVNEETTLAQNSEIQSSVLSPANLKEGTNPTEETGPQGTGRSSEELHSATQNTVEIDRQITLPDVTEPKVQSTLSPATQTVLASQVAIETISAINPEAANQLAPMLQAHDSSPTLEQMRQWWRQALEIGRPPEHLQKIKEVGIAVKTGTGQATTEDLSQMQRDQQKWQQVKTLVDQAHRFLDQIGKDEFQKDNYRIQRSGNQLTITDIKEGRGDIVRVDGETLRSKVMKKDVERFATVDKLVQKLHRTTASAAISEHSS